VKSLSWPFIELRVEGTGNDMELARILRNVMPTPALESGGHSNAWEPQRLHSLCIRTAAIYATTSLYEFHDKQRSSRNSSAMAMAQGGSPAAVDLAAAGGGHGTLIHEAGWEKVKRLLD